MPVLRQDILSQAESSISAEANKQRDERGLGCSIEYVRERGNIVAYRVSVQTDNGLRITYADIPATREPTNEEVDAIVMEYGDNLVAEIKRRRTARKARAESIPR